MKRFITILTLVFFVLRGSLVYAQTAYQYDILLKGGHVIDPANHINRVMDVAIKDSTIARIDATIPPQDAAKTLDVSGYYVTPGLIDIHAHLFYTFFTSAARGIIPDDFSFSSGVTTMVDAGTSGADSFEKFKSDVVDRSDVRVLAFINIAAPGMNAAEQDPLKFDVQKAVAMAKKYPDIIVGFKTAHYWTTQPYDELHTPWASVDSLIKAGNLAGLPVMIDFYPRQPQGNYPERSYRELILKKMRPGDIHTHCYARHFPVIKEDGTVNPDILEAQKEGRIFDVGHGAGSFVFRNAVPAINQGYLPNSISTDLHGANTNGPVVNLLNVMSKFLCMGLSLEEVIRETTVNPAHEIKHPELGTLNIGSSADIAIIKLLEGDFGYADTSAGKITGNKKLQCFMTFYKGKIVFDPSGYSRPYWKDIPKDSDYWKNPSGQLW
jgi:dihydroorotase